MNNNDLLCTNNLDDQYNINNQYNIFNPILPKDNTDEVKRENMILQKNIPNNIYTNDIYNKNNKIINYNDLKNSNPVLTDNDVKKSYETNTLLNNINSSDAINTKKMCFDRPIESEVNRDYIKKRYQKIKKTNVSIYSEDRNLELSILPNNFDVPLNKTYKNIEKITLKSIYFPNSIPVLNEFNNRFTWQYPSINDNTNIFIPDPSNNNLNNGILQDIEWEKLLPSSNKELIYSTKLNINYATTSEFTKEFTKQLSYSYHYQNYINYQNKYDLKCSDISNNEFETDDLSGNINLNNQAFNFDLDINTINHVVKLVNRIEKLSIYSIQIFKKDGTSNDILNNYSDTPAKILKKNRIYLTIKESDYNDISMNSISNNNIFPLVITNCVNTGNISQDIINYTPFYSNDIYTDRYPTLYSSANPPESVSTFQYFDKITLTDTLGNSNSLVRLELALSNGNINGLYFNRSGNIIKTNSTQTIITNRWLENFLNNLNPTIVTSNDYFKYNELNNLPLIGRALPIKLINKIKSSDLYNSSNLNINSSELNDDSNKLNSRNVIESVLDVLGWPNQHNCNNGKNISLKENYYFIHSNIDSFRLNTLTNLEHIELNPRNIFRYMTPQKN